MKNQFALIATKELFKADNIDKFSSVFNLNKLTFIEQVNVNESLQFNFSKKYIDIYSCDTGTLAFFSSPDLLEDIELEVASYKCANGAFWFDEKSSSCSITIYKNFELLVNYVQIHGKEKQNIQHLPELQSDNKLIYVIKAITWINGLNISELNDITLSRYELTTEKLIISKTSNVP